VKLKCKECGREADVEAHGWTWDAEPALRRALGVVHGSGWRTYLTVEEEGPAEHATYCPDCAPREFAYNDVTRQEEQ
jgi:hypothetical protein